MGRGPFWTEAEHAVIRDNPCLSAAEIAALLPHRSQRSVQVYVSKARKTTDRPAVKEPGEYVELLSEFLVDEFDCMAIWLKWNGYASYEVLSRDRNGYLTLKCTAK